MDLNTHLAKAFNSKKCNLKNKSALSKNCCLSPMQTHSNGALALCLVLQLKDCDLGYKEKETRAPELRKQIFKQYFLGSNFSFITFEELYCVPNLGAVFF